VVRAHTAHGCALRTNAPVGTGSGWYRNLGNGQQRRRELDERRVRGVFAGGLGIVGSARILGILLGHRLADQADEQVAERVRERARVDRWIAGRLGAAQQHSGAAH
jgi:hypothetical protein